MADGLLHAHVRKRFGAHFYSGRVTELWARGNYEYAHVVYDDDDCEDLAVADARALVVRAEGKPGAAAAPAVAVRAGSARKMTDYMGQPVAAAGAAKKRRCVVAPRLTVQFFAAVVDISHRAQPARCSACTAQQARCCACCREGARREAQSGGSGGSKGQAGPEGKSPGAHGRAARRRRRGQAGCAGAA